MGFRSNTFAKVWSVEDKGNFTKVRLSISRKNKNTGEYEQQFSGFCTFCGNAHAGASRLKQGDNIKLGEVDVTNRYDAAKKCEYTNFLVYGFEMAGGAPSGNNNNQTARRPGGNHVEGNNVESEELPF